MCSLSVFVQRPSKLSNVEPAWASVADTATTQPMSNCYPWALVSSSKNSCCRMYQHRSVGSWSPWNVRCPKSGMRYTNNSESSLHECSSSSSGPQSGQSVIHSAWLQLPTSSCLEIYGLVRTDHSAQALKLLCANKEERNIASLPATWA